MCNAARFGSHSELDPEWIEDDSPTQESKAANAQTGLFTVQACIFKRLREAMLWEERRDRNSAAQQQLQELEENCSLWDYTIATNQNRNPHEVQSLCLKCSAAVYRKIHSLSFGWRATECHQFSVQLELFATWVQRASLCLKFERIFLIICCRRANRENALNIGLAPHHNQITRCNPKFTIGRRNVTGICEIHNFRFCRDLQ